MADTPNSALAGAGNASAQPEGMSVLDMHWEGDPQQPVDDLEGSEAEESPEPSEVEDNAELAGSEEAEIAEAGEEDEGPADDAAEPEAPTNDDDETIHGNKFVVLRDNSKVRVGELKASHERLQEIERHLPQIQQERVRYQQQIQALSTQQQQLQPILAQVATVLQNQLPPEPDAALVDPNSPKYDPIEHYHQTLARNQAVARVQQVNQAYQQQLTAQKQREEQETTAQRAAALQAFIAHRPEFNDKAKADWFVQGREKLRQRLSLPPEAPINITHPGVHEMVRLAIVGAEFEEGQVKVKQDKAQKAQVAARKVAAVPPVTPPAARQSAGVRQDQSSRGALERLRKTGSTADAEAFLSQFE